LKKTLVAFLLLFAISACSTPQPSLEVKNICSYIDTYLEKSKKDYRDNGITDASYTVLAEYIVSSGKLLDADDFRNLKSKVRKFAKLYKKFKVAMVGETENLEVAEGLALQPELIAIQNEFCFTPPSP
jgi:hypothetical protein